MTSNRNRRIAKEIADIHNDQHSKIVVEPAGNGCRFLFAIGKK
jgi:ubiquitin-conjugating enzyme (huntingtin interacting protein 2)